MYLTFSGCFCGRFNHELVFGVSVKNLSKAERLMYGDSLMTHAMILTAVTDKVCIHKLCAQAHMWSANSPQTHTSRASQGFAVCLQRSNPLKFFRILSISFLVSKRSCSNTFSLWPSSCPRSFRRGRKGMKSGEWKTPGGTTVETKVQLFTFLSTKKVNWFLSSLVGW